MWQFAHQDAARATAEEAMNLLFPAAPALDLIGGGGCLDCAHDP